MKRYQKYIALITMALGFYDPVNSQSLEQLLFYADSSNLELKALHQEYLASLEKAPQVSQLPDPEAGLGIFALPVETRLGAQWVRFSATQMFPWKGTLEARKDVALTAASAKFEKVAASRLNLHYQIKQAWFQLYEISTKQKILEESISIYKTIESIATNKLETGSASLADVLRIQIKIRNLEEELKILENQKVKPNSTINRLLNRSSGRTIQVNIGDLELAMPMYDRTGLLRDIQNNHPMLRMFKLQQEIARKQIALNTLEGKPSFAAGLDYITVARRSDATPESNGRDILTPRIGVRIPLYRDKYRAKEQEELIRIESLETWKEDWFLQFRTSIEKAYADIEEGRIKFNLYSEQKETTQSVIDLMLIQYSTENTGFVDLLLLEEQLIDYKLMQLTAVVKTQVAQAEIERYIP